MDKERNKMLYVKRLLNPDMKKGIPDEDGIINNVDKGIIKVEETDEDFNEYWEELDSSTNKTNISTAERIKVTKDLFKK